MGTRALSRQPDSKPTPAWDVLNRSTPASTGRTNGQSLAAPDTIAACRRPLSLPLIRSEAVAPGPEGRQTIAQRVSAGFRPPSNIQPRQGRQNPGAVVESSIARDCPTARLLSTETGHGTDCWPARRDILAGDWARWSRGSREAATPQRPKASAGSGRGHQTPLKCRPSLRLSWINCQMDRSDPIAPSAVRPVAAPNRLLPTTSVPPMIRSESRGTRPGGPPDDSPARERWVPSPQQHPAPAGATEPWRRG